MSYSPRTQRPAPSEREQAVINHLFAFSTGNSFYSDLLAKSMRYVLSENQMACVERNMERDEAKVAETAEKTAKGIVVKAGKQTIEGVVVSTKIVDGYRGDEVLKLLVETADGLRYWGTAPHGETYTVGTDNPNKWLSGVECIMNRQTFCVEVGTKLTFIASVKPSPNDKQFGFYSRPQWVDLGEPVQDDDDDTGYVTLD